MKKLIERISTKTGAAKLSMAVVIGLVVLKVVVSIISNSVSIIAQAADSLLDIFSIGITFMAVRMSTSPADKQHQFGHGKMEGLAALLQAVLVLGAGGFIIYSSIQRIINSTPIQPDEGIGVMLVSIIASFLLSRHLHKVARATGSTAIDASAQNISADVYSAAGVLLGLLVVRFTNLVILDPIIALVMAGFVLKAGFGVTTRAIHELTDYALPKEEQEKLINCIKVHNTQLVDFHAVRSRRAGSERFIDLHIVMPRYYSIKKAHDMCDHLEQDILSQISNANIIIHAEPCEFKDCTLCSITICEIRQN